ncbi:DUF4864 domain-containing protein [Maritimibacter sp. HL-12]|uniref:DUF4864 domain-containing protein n=1 Tax=Maritimibacter sp. HL-12 TaxID=1162418 RepID=UPI000A0F25D9|nr:DUF4864 domain-containing protein [Maritimibacter sp. HL-12]SMH32543.1 protein of unknown function [Maritimibacter sp. HL-12]
MKQIILVLAMIVVWAFPLRAAEPEDGIRAVISSQFEAFLADDVEAAFGYAAPAIQRIFITPEGFGSMVQNGYPMVWRPAERRFLELRDLDGALWQKVLIRDQAGAWHLLDYEMLRVGSDWRIGGVQYLRQAEVGA